MPSSAIQVLWLCLRPCGVRPRLDGEQQASGMARRPSLAAAGVSASSAFACATTTGRCRCRRRGRLGSRRGRSGGRGRGWAGRRRCRGTGLCRPGRRGSGQRGPGTLGCPARPAPCRDRGGQRDSCCPVDRVVCPCRRSARRKSGRRSGHPSQSSAVRPVSRGAGSHTPVITPCGISPFCVAACPRSNGWRWRPGLAGPGRPVARVRHQYGSRRRRYERQRSTARTGVKVDNPHWRAGCQISPARWATERS